MAEKKELSLSVSGVMPDGLSIALAFKAGFKPVAVWDAYTAAVAEQTKGIADEHKAMLFSEVRDIIAYHWKRRDRR